MSKTNPNIPPSQSKIVPPYIPPPKPIVRTIPLHIADAAVAACEKEIQELREEVARLKSIREQAYYTKPDGTIALVNQDAEVERLTDENVTLRVERMQDETGKRITYADYASLKAEVERLRKAGDDLYKSMLEIGCNEMADNFQYDAWWGSMKAWNAAKEGKQP